MKITGVVECWNGSVLVGRFHNDVLYSGYDLSAKCISGDAASVVNGMYIQFRNGAPSEPTISLDRTPAFYSSLVDPEGCVRVKSLALPSYSATSADYESNRVQFVAQTSSTSFAGAAVQDGVSQFYTVALAAIPDIDDPSKDVLFSAAPIYAGGVFAPQLKMANAQLTFVWKVTFAV